MDFLLYKFTRDSLVESAICIQIAGISVDT